MLPRQGAQVWSLVDELGSLIPSGVAPKKTFLSKIMHVNLLGQCVQAKSFQSCLTLWNPMNCIVPGSFVHGILQARILKWVAIPSSRKSSQPRDQTHISCLLNWQAGSLPLAPSGKMTMVVLKVWLPSTLWSKISHQSRGPPTSG